GRRLRSGFGRSGTGLGRPGICFGKLVVGIWLARARNDQSRRHGPGRHEVLWIIPAEQASTLPLFLPRVLLREGHVTIPTRLVTFCTHHRPQSRHTFSGKYRSAPILTLSRPNGIARRLDVTD